MCELVYAHILNEAKDTFQYHPVKIYRDDGLPEMKGLSGPQVERMKKELLKLLKIMFSRLPLK